MEYLKSICDESEQFRDFIGNSAFKRQQQWEVLESLTSNLHEYSTNLLSTLVDNRRLSALPKVCEKYIEYYRIQNKEENIIIVSAEELSADYQDKVKQALIVGRNSQNFKLTFNVDPSIQGGLQMYSGLEFLDCSLASRIFKLRSELQKISF